MKPIRFRNVSFVATVASLFVVAPLTAQPALVGFESCGASGCHGAVQGIGPAWSSSHQVWSARDPHAWAGAILHREDSQHIVANLDPTVRDKSGDGTIDVEAEAYQRVLARRCISCHVTSSADDQAGSNLSSIDANFVAQGVACESCHGPASEWLESHVLSSWPALGTEQRHGLGMVATESWLARVEMCSKCHVGSHTHDGLVRDVNHDLIAAGHPQLRFDAWLYTQNMPAHWAPGPVRENDVLLNNVQQWRSGKWMSVEAAARLDASRQASSTAETTRTPWPELASYDCFGCHHAMETEGVHATSRNGGYPTWNGWLIAGLETEELRLPRLSPRLADFDMSGITKVARQAASSTVSTSAVPGTEALRAARQAPINHWNSAAASYLLRQAALADCRVDGSLSTPQIAAQSEHLARFLDHLSFGEILNSPGEFNLQTVQQSMAEWPSPP